MVKFKLAQHVTLGFGSEFGRKFFMPRFIFASFDLTLAEAL